MVHRLSLRGRVLVDVNVLRLDAAVADHLRAAALVSVAKRLDASGDCVVCHCSLGPGPVSVSLIMRGGEVGLTHVLPAHAACQPSTLTAAEAGHVGAPLHSNRTVTLALPALGPMMLINEQVDVLSGHLEDGRWTDMPHVPHDGGSDMGRLMGLVKLDAVERPLPPESARWGARIDRRGELTVTGPLAPYSASVPNEVGAAIRRAGKLLVLVTDEVRISDLLAAGSAVALYTAVQQGHVHGAWAVLGADPADVQFGEHDPLAGLRREAGAAPETAGNAGMPIPVTPLTGTAEYTELETDKTVTVRAGFSDHRALRLSLPGAPRYPVLLLEPKKMIGLTSPGRAMRDLRVEDVVNNGLHRMPPAPGIQALMVRGEMLAAPSLVNFEDLLNPARDWVVQAGGGGFRAVRVQLRAPFDRLVAEGDLRYPPGWRDAADAAGTVLVLYGPMIGARKPSGRPYNDDDRHRELDDCRAAGMVAWGRVTWRSGRRAAIPQPTADDQREAQASEVLRGLGLGPSDGDAARLQLEVAEALDPNQERSMVIDDSGTAIIDPGKVLQNLRARMERVDLDPDTSWSAEELMSYDEATMMFAQLQMGEIVVADTAWRARQVLSRWPRHLVEHPIAAEARLDMFYTDSVTINDGHQDLGRRILNRALASPQEVESHPELEGLGAEELTGVWLALVYWFGIKSGLLHQHDRGQDPSS